MEKEFFDYRAAAARAAEHYENLLREALHEYAGSGPRRGSNSNKKSPRPEMGRFIDPLTDWGFRHLFGNRHNTEILISFLNDLFQGEKVIRKIQFANNELDGQQPTDRRVIFDLHCTAENGEIFIVEMQRFKQPYFKDRSLFYVSQVIQDQLDRGAADQHYRLPEIYFIGILDFPMDSNHAGTYLHDIALLDKKTQQQFYNKLGLKFLEIATFDKSQDQLHSDLDKWMYLLKYMKDMDQIPKYFDRRVFSTIFKLAEIAGLKKEDQMVYRTDWMREMDRKAVMDYAIEEGREAGKTETAKKLISDFGFTEEQAASATGLPLDKVKEIVAGME